MFQENVPCKGNSAQDKANKMTILHLQGVKLHVCNLGILGKKKKKNSYQGNAL